MDSCGDISEILTKWKNKAFSLGQQTIHSVLEFTKYCVYKAHLEMCTEKYTPKKKLQWVLSLIMNRELNGLTREQLQHMIVKMKNYIKQVNCANEMQKIKFWQHLPKIHQNVESRKCALWNSKVMRLNKRANNHFSGECKHRPIINVNNFKIAK